MASQAQIDANRRNSQRSTGPKTDEGKSKSSLNALKHGFFSQHLVLPGEDEAEMETLRAGILNRLRPADALEELYAERVIVAAWKLRRVIAAERESFLIQRHNYREFETAAEMLAKGFGPSERLEKYAASLERAMDKALDQLRKLQANRPEEPIETPKQGEQNKANSEKDISATDGAQMNTDQTESEMETERTQSSSSSVSICAPTVAKINAANGENKANSPDIDVILASPHPLADDALDASSAADRRGR